MLVYSCMLCCVVSSPDNKLSVQGKKKKPYFDLRPDAALCITVCATLAEQRDTQIVLPCTTTTPLLLY